MYSYIYWLVADSFHTPYTELSIMTIHATLVRAQHIESL